MKHCPRCRSERIHLSRRRGFVERVLLAMVFVKPLRCERCDFRFFRVSFTANVNASRQATTY
jgi:predicted Zn-ribbon and HTH transcriptional regulator